MAQPFWGAIDPSVVTDQAALDRQQALAQFLRQQSLTPMGGTEMAGNVAVRRSPLEGLAKLVAGYQASQMDKGNDTARQALAVKTGEAMRQAFSGLTGDAPQQPAQEPSAAMAGPSAPMPIGPTGPTPGPGALGSALGGTPQGTQGDRIKRAAQSAFLMGNTDLANKLLGNLLEMTTEQKNMAAMGQDPLLMGQLATAAARKAGIMEMQPGATAIDLATGVERFNPKVAEGIQLNGGVASQVPGYAQAASGLAGANAQATEGAKMMNVQLPDGSTRQMTQAQYLALTTPQGAGNPRPDVAQAANRAGDANYTFDVGGQKGIVTGGQVAAPQELGQGPNPVKQAAEKAYQEGVAKDQVDQRKSIMTAGMGAGAKIAKYQQLDRLLADFEGGKLSQGAMDFASLGNSLGLKIDSKLPNKEAAAVISNQLALEARSTAEGGGMPGAMSEGDRKFLVAMTPSMSQTAEGRKTIISSAIAMEQRKAQVAEFARKYENKYGKLDNGFYSQLQSWSDQNPLFGGK